MRDIGEVFNISHASSDANVTLAPGLQTSLQVVRASKVVKAHVVFDFKILNGQPRVLDLEAEVRRNLGISLGVSIAIQLIPSTGDHAVRIANDYQLAECITSYQDEITIQVSKSGVRHILPWISLVISLADFVTTILFAIHLLDIDKDTEHISGIVVIASLILAVCLNFVQAFVHIKNAIGRFAPTQEWVSYHVCETAFGLLMSGFNVLNLECLWSHYNLPFLKLNFHCPVLSDMSKMSGLQSIPALILSDGVPIAAALLELSHSTKGWYTVASISTSAASLALSVVKKVILVLFVTKESVEKIEEGLPHEVKSSAPVQLRKRQVTLLKFNLSDMAELEQRPSSLSALGQKFLEVGHHSIKSHGGSILSYTEDSIDAVFGATNRELPNGNGSVSAVRSTLQFLSNWPSARANALQASKSMYNVTTSLVTNTGYIGHFGPRARRELKIVGGINSELASLNALVTHDGIPLAMNEVAEQSVFREGYLIRPIDIVKDCSGSVHTVYQVLDSKSTVGKQWGGATAKHWNAVFGTLTAGTIAQAYPILLEYLRTIGSNDEIADNLRIRLQKAHTLGGFRYARHYQPGSWNADMPERERESAAGSMSPELRSLSEIVVPVLQSAFLSDRLRASTSPENCRRPLPSPSPPVLPLHHEPVVAVPLPVSPPLDLHHQQRDRKVSFISTTSTRTSLSMKGNPLSGGVCSSIITPDTTPLSIDSPLDSSLTQLNIPPQISNL